MPSYVSSTFVTILVFSLTFVSAAPASQEGEYELQFDLVDAATGKPIRDAAILCKEDDST